MSAAAVLHEIVSRLPYDGNPDAKPALHAAVSVDAGEQLDDDWAERYGVTAEQLADLQEQHGGQADEPEPDKGAGGKAVKSAASPSK